MTCNIGTFARANISRAAFMASAAIFPAFVTPVAAQVAPDAATAPAPSAASTSSSPAAAKPAVDPATGTNPSAPSGESVTQDGDIVVTARLRSESLQTVPVAISALTGSSLVEKGINNLQDLSRSVPTVDFRSGASGKDRSVFIRGVGTITTSPGVEPSVSTVLDGVVFAKSGQATADLLDIERVEVLRGPQGTLFGKNASAGVINIVTKAPTETFTGSANASYFSGNEWRLAARVSGPISDNLLFSLSGLAGHFDGNQRNLTTGNEVNGYTRRGVRGKLQFEPTETLKITLGADFLYNRDNVPNGTYVASSRVLYPSGAVQLNPQLAGVIAASGVVLSSDNRDVASNFDSRVLDKNYGGFVNAELDLGDFHVTSITGLRRWRNFMHEDYDETTRQILPAGATTLPVSGEDRGEVNSRQFSQELRLASPRGDLIDYVVGIYYLRAKQDEVYTRIITRVEPATTSVYTATNHYGTLAHNYAAFGEANINFTKNFRAFAGGRLIYDDLSFYLGRVSNSPPPSGVTGAMASLTNSGSRDKTDYSGRVGLQFDVSSKVHTYVTASRGYKGPAYNLSLNATQADGTGLGPETSKAYEAGIKASTFDNRLRVNLAAFTTTFDGFQTNFPTPFNGAISTRLTNAGTVRVRGFEGDVSAKPVKALTLTGSFAYNDAKIIRFICPSGATCPNYDGKPLPFAPKWRSNVDATYTIAVSDGLDVELNTDCSYKSKTQYLITQNPDTIQPGYGIWNAAVAIVSKDGWELRGVVKNISNTHYSSYLNTGFIAGLVRYVPRDDHRYYGMIASYNF